ncbi:PREDICTED: target of Nesh-SH3 isoform X16 [Chinchilla lanigera]|uniref:target of Nesh-SH3 isoform X16 n=1 Tax=Chinchilla lanigera TaxID=34839 RepID=UPI000695C63D|nr:PREDICTED: target of Nesh-SH3 isoform X16 [Chinchilla lanigera]
MQRPPLPLEDSPLKCGSRAARHPPASLPVGGSKCNMPSSLGCLLLCGSIALALGNAQKLPKGKKPSLKVHINTTSDSILLKFLRPNPNVKLEGFLLGYGSNVSPNQYFPLPTEGKYAEAVVDAEPKYLIVVRPVPPPSQKKSCSGKTRARKPLQLVVGTLSPSSVFLSWGFLINPHHDWTLPSHCPNDRLYTIRYREKDKEKKWIFQLCPATETIVDNLKPNTVYEFGVKDNVEGGIWSKIFNHKTIVGSKNKVNGKIQSTYDQVHTVPAYIPRKLIPVTIIKQVIQNVTHRASTKSPDKTPFGGTILVHFIIPGLNDTSAKLPPSIMLEISDALKAQLAKNETLALPVESKTLEVDKITAQHITVTPETVPRTTKPTMSSTPDISQTALVLSQRTQETLQTILLPKFELPRSTPAPKGLLEFPEAKTSFPFEKFGVTSVTSEKSWMAPAAKTLGDSGVVKPHTVPTTDTEPVLPRTGAPVTTLAPKITQRTRTRRPRPKHKSTVSPKVHQTKPDFGPITPGPSLAPTKRTHRPHPKPKTTPRPETPQTVLVPTTIAEPVIVRTEAPGPTLAPKVPQHTPPHPKPKTTWRTGTLQTELVPTEGFEQVAPVKEAPKTAIDTDPEPPVTELEPVTFRAETSGTTLATKIPKRTRRPRPRPKTTWRPQAPQTKPVPATAIEPVTLHPEAAGTTLAPKPSQWTHQPHPRPKPIPSLEAPEPTPVPTAGLEPVTLRPETWVTTQAPKTSKRTRRPRPRPRPRPRLKPKATPSPKASQIVLSTFPATDLEPGTLRTGAPDAMVLTTVLEPVTLRTKAPETTLAPKILRTRRPRPRPKTTSSPEASQTQLVPVPGFQPDIHSTEAPETTLAPTEPQTLILTPVTSPSLEMAYSQPVSDILESVTFNTESSKETIAPAKTDYVYPTTKIPPRPEEPKTEGVVESVPPEITLALRQTPRTTPKTKTSQHPRIPQTQPVPKGPPRATSRPKTSPSPEVSHTTYGPEDVPFPHEQDPDVSQSEPVLQPVTFRIEPPKTTTAPSETRGIPLIPIISPSLSQEELLPTFEETDQTTQELFTTKIPQELFTTKIPQTTELAKTTQAPRRLYTIPVRPRIPDRPPVRPVLNRTTTKPIRPRPSGIPSRNGVGTGPKQGPKPSGPVRNVSVDSTQATKRPATIPGTRRPPLPPRPVPPRRKPLPPNNVTGKPGSSGIISSHRVTSPPLKATLKPTLTTSERPETDKKQPTAPASGEEFGNTTDFSSSPTRETDHLGKPRFKGPHVRYIPKPESKPCSITDSVQRFPTEEAMEGHATSPPQNPPTNLTVVTVEGCPSFVILDWEKPLNDTVTEYEVISRENGSFSGKNKSIQVTNQTFSTVENLKPDTSYEFQVKPKNPLGEGPASNTVAFSTESADPRVSEPVSAGRDAIWTERPFNSDSYSECKGKQYVKRTWYKKFVGVQLCNSLRYKIYLSDSLTGQFYNIGDQRGHGEDHCQFVDSFLDGRTGQHLSPDQLPTKEGYFRAVRQEPVQFGEIGGHTQINYVQWYECGTTIPGKW